MSVKHILSGGKDLSAPADEAAMMSGTGTADVQADAVSDEQEDSSAVRQARFWLRFLMVAVLIGGGAAALYYFLYTPMEGDGEAVVSTLSGDGAPVGPILSNTVARENDLPAPEPVPSRSLDSVSGDIADLRSDLGAMESRLTDMASVESGLSTRLAEHADTAERVIAALDARLSALESGSSDRLVAMQSRVDGLARGIEGLETKVGVNERRILRLSRRGKGGPPFGLVSIDEWGGVVSAVLEMAGVTTVAAAGDERAGWRVTKIDRPCVYVVRIAGGKSAKICTQEAS